jgi:hypothetical protein
VEAEDLGVVLSSSGYYNTVRKELPDKAKPKAIVALLRTLGIRQGRHSNPATYSKFHAPRNSGVDGQGVYFGGPRCELVNDVFRSLTIDRCPELWQSLPAEKEHELESREDVAKI